MFRLHCKGGITLRLVQECKLSLACMYWKTSYSSYTVYQTKGKGGVLHVAKQSESNRGNQQCVPYCWDLYKVCNVNCFSLQ